jgi:hypothetical protein
MGAPPAELLAKLKKRSTHINFDFPSKEGTGAQQVLGGSAPCSNRAGFRRALLAVASTWHWPK